MAHYILQTVVFQLLFLVVYDFLLKKETFFNWNRIYILVTPLLSFILPLIKSEFIRQYIPEHYTVKLPAVLVDTNPANEILLPEVIVGSQRTLFSYFTVSNMIALLWLAGIIISTYFFLFKLWKIQGVKKSGVKTRMDNFTLISIPNSNTAFSFFKMIFLGDRLSEEKIANILSHEKIHVQEYHSIDLIFFELLRILFWFNPLVYVYQNRIATLQEYIADSKAIIETDKKEYYKDLLSQIFQTDKISFINTFFNHSLIKNRIVMLQKSKSKKIFQLKYLLLIPVTIMMLVYASCSQDANAHSASQSEKSNSELIKRIEAVKEQIQVQGHVSTEEERALLQLASIVSDGASDPFFGNSSGLSGLNFGDIEETPVFPGCENLSPKEARKCFSNKLTEFINAEFNTNITKENNLTGRQEIKVQFQINKEGKVGDVKVKHPNAALSNEAIRLARKLPVMRPGKQNGAPVDVVYNLPIVFEVN